MEFKAIIMKANQLTNIEQTLHQLLLGKLSIEDFKEDVKNKKFDINSEDKNYVTPLLLLMRSSDNPKEEINDKRNKIISEFLMLGAKPEITDMFEVSPLSFVLSNQARHNKDMEIIIIKHFYEAHINKVWEQSGNKNYIIPKIHNIAENDLKSLKQVVDTFNEDNNSLMHHASATGFFEKVAVLLYLGADKNPVNNDAKTPLMVSVDNNYKNIVILLLANGADSSELGVDYFGDSVGVDDKKYVEDWAKEHNYQDILENYFNDSDKIPDLSGLTLTDTSAANVEML